MRLLLSIYFASRGRITRLRFSENVMADLITRAEEGFVYALEKKEREEGGRGAREELDKLLFEISRKSGAITKASRNEKRPSSYRDATSM